MSDSYNAHADDGRRKIKKENNVDQSIQILTDRGIELKRHTRYHYCITGNLGKIDFWPSTGKYLTSYNTTIGRGVFNLIKEVDKARG
ncbi:MAG: hypothetical protein COA94_04885 [Rickettsiales bacterium]|nr:MAG: hypothetical protein COA94_04885 [Rickettsiales bacterium]